MKLSNTPKAARCTDGSCELMLPAQWRERPVYKRDSEFEAYKPSEGQEMSIVHEERTGFVPNYNIDNYLPMIMADHEKVSPNIRWSQIARVKINGVEARIVTAIDVDHGESFRSIIAVTETENGFLQMAISCNEKDFAKNEKELMEAVYSLRSTASSNQPKKPREASPENPFPEMNQN